jgi:serine/threonine-protein kinase
MPTSYSSLSDASLEPAFKARLEAFERAWEQHNSSEPPPRWQDWLPSAGELSPPAFLFWLLATDIKCRIAAGMPGLLAEPYFIDQLPGSATAESELLAELVRCEYRQRWARGERARRQEYLERFPHLSHDLADLVPVLVCPSCGEEVRWANEDADTANCSSCGIPVPTRHHAAAAVVPLTRLSLGVPPGAGPDIPLTQSPLVTDHQDAPPVWTPSAPAPRRLGRYELGEEIAHGGMGAVFHAHDPELHRHLAVKVLKPELRTQPHLVRRFLIEARITGQLQHPGIVAIHDIGRDDNGLPFLVLKLVRGETLSDLLRQRSSVADDLPRWLGVFEQVCQALAFAHSRRVIHRDLKPANVMVGRFQEVQVMDWGLAKVLSASGELDDREQGDAEFSLVETLEEGVRTHGTLGTLHYMPPEQALGEWECVDERADVFALGGILCEILTGEPTYTGRYVGDVMARARRGAIDDACARMAACGADSELVALARDCLNTEIEKRPRDAGVIAERVAAYQRGVQERLRQAEQERAAAQARATEERKRRRLTLMLAAVVLVAVVSGGWLLQQQRARQQEATGKTMQAVEHARALLKQGWDNNDLTKLKDAQAEAKRAVEIAQSGAADQTTQAAATAVQQEAEERLARADKDRTLLDDLLNIWAPQETRSYRSDASGQMTALARLSEDEQYAAALRRRWPDLDIDRSDPAVVVARLGDEPQPVVEEVLAGLDGWLLYRRQTQQFEAAQHLHRLAEQLDRNGRRRALRAVLSGEWPPPVGMVAGVGGLGLPWTALWQVEQGERWRQVMQLRQQVSVTQEPALSVVLLARACRVTGDFTGAESVLREAVTVRPNDAVLLHLLAQLLVERRRLTQAIEYYRAARALRPHLGVALGEALRKSGREKEGDGVLRDLIDKQPNNPELHLHMGYVLSKQKKVTEAEKAYRKATELDPSYAMAHNGLGTTLAHQGKVLEAMQEFREAIELDPRDAMAHNNLGLALREQGKVAEAIQEHRKAIELDPRDAMAHTNLGNALREQGKVAEAMQEYHKAIELDPRFARAHYNLGVALGEQRKLVEAIQEYRKATELDPKLALAHTSLGTVLQAQGKVLEAMQEFREAVELDPKLALAHNNLGLALQVQGKVGEAIQEYRKAIELDPREARAHGALGQALLQQGDFPEALEATRRCRQLLPPQHPLREAFAQPLLRRCEAAMALSEKLPAILRGDARPADAAEALALAQLCQQFKKMHAAAARLYADAFAGRPILAEDLQASHRYHAACSAALAAAGKGTDADAIGDPKRAGLRRQALDWLRADLKAHGGLLEKNRAAAPGVQQALAHWLEDTDLAGVRDAAALAKLPDAERDAWKQLWADTEAVLKRSAGK